MALHAPGAHEPLVETPWDEDAARAAIETIVAELDATFDEASLWRTHQLDLEPGDDPDEPFTGVYLGAAGIVYALARLARSGRASSRLDLGAIAAGLQERYLEGHELAQAYPPPQPSLLFGESGILLVADSLNGAAADRERLLAVVRANAGNAVNELCWGSPGTMLAALALLRRTGDERFADAWRGSADRLLGDWRGEVWTQVLYGREQRCLGPGHGFAGCLHALLRGRDLLGAERTAKVERRAIAVLERTARREPGLAQWPAALGEAEEPRRIRTQWCHGAPGVVAALALLLPVEPPLDELLSAGGELTWRAGPLVKGPGLCHGTAGNGFAFLALLERTGDERWLERARRFAMHAAAQVEREREAHGRSRPTLFTGAAGVALYLDACIVARAGFPFLDDA
jgi:lantibiotic modifying enzyme